jgi:hypothetical protein
MFQKRTVPDATAGTTGAKRLRAGIADVFLDNEISSVKANFMAKAAHDAGVDHMKDLALASGRHAGTQASNKKHMARNLIRAFLKRSRWPNLYFAPIRIWNPKTMQEETQLIGFCLPHEYLYTLAASNSLAALSHQSGFSAGTRQHVQTCEAALKMQPGELIGFGIWGDGVPCNWDRSQSMDMFTLSLPGLPADKSELRLPIVALNRKFIVVEHTFDDICGILAWSFKQCALRQMPGARHDGAPWNQSDSKRKVLAGKILPKAILAEVRGDWVFMKQCFRFPQHNEVGGLCFKCVACPATYKDCSSEAPWRQQRLGHWGLMQRFLERGISVSPLFGSPYLSSVCFQLDWLHVADLGITPNCLGSLLWIFQKTYPGNNMLARCREMYVDLNQWYIDNGTESRLDMLLPTMIKTSKKPHHLRGKGAEIRALVPWAHLMSQKLLLDTDPEQHTAKIAMMHLDACYECLSSQSFTSSALKENSRKFSLLYVSLEALKPDGWHVVPKLHLFQEMCEMTSTRPSCVWGYRDESFGGYLATLCRLRGGKNSPVAAGRSMLHKFHARHTVPRL